MVRIFNLNIALHAQWWFYPAALVMACTGVGIVTEKIGLVKSFYASPFVLVVAMASLRSGRRGGLLAAFMSMIIFNFVFVHPSWEFTIPTNEELLAYISMFLAAYYIGGFQVPQTTNTLARFAGSLPFVRNRKRDETDEAPRCFWDVTASGRWVADCEVGHEYARIYIERRKRFGAPLLGWIVRDMIAAGQYSGVEAGFMGGIARQLPSRQTMPLVLVSDEHADDRQVY